MIGHSRPLPAAAAAAAARIRTNPINYVRPTRPERAALAGTARNGLLARFGRAQTGGSSGRSGWTRGPPAVPPRGRAGPLGAALVPAPSGSARESFPVSGLGPSQPQLSVGRPAGWELRARGQTAAVWLARPTECGASNEWRAATGDWRASLSPAPFRQPDRLARHLPALCFAHPERRRTSTRTHASARRERPLASSPR